MPRRSPSKVTRYRVDTIDEGIEALRAGELVVYPTETSYGIAADPFSGRALQLLFELKGRDAAKTVAMIAADAKAAFSLSREVSAVARRLADSFWPGPLTLVLPARPDLAPELVGPGGGVGVRVSPHPVAQTLAAGLGRPITATSANRAGQPPARTLAEAHAALGGKIKVFLEGGTLGASAPSTVVEVTGDDWRIIREGAVSRGQIAIALAGEALE